MISFIRRSGNGESPGTEIRPRAAGGLGGSGGSTKELCEGNGCVLCLESGGQDIHMDIYDILINICWNSFISEVTSGRAYFTGCRLHVDKLDFKKKTKTTQRYTK